jgi:hypothetical protein
MRAESFHASRLCFSGLLRQVVLLGHLLADGGKLTGHLMLEFFQFGAWLRCAARFGGITLFQLGLALRYYRRDGFPLRIDKQILQILIRKRGNPVI